MALKKIYIWPEPILSAKAKPVEHFDDELLQLSEDMYETMYAANGVGLSGNQVGELKRILTVDLDPHKEADKEPELKEELESWGFKHRICIVNPVITQTEGEIIWNEGCLSVPGYTDDVTRHEHIIVEGFDPKGNPVKYEASDLFSVAIQHEIDHLDGRVFVEYLSKVKRDSVKRKMKRLKVNDIDDGLEAAQLLADGQL